ncbi:hypothetical protein FKP32DRAFT_1616900 [Trametes sanguinea]|nr:hypothetical protein FKP32DRAFT_1616900 [Trametes sanguinea]
MSHTIIVDFATFERDVLGLGPSDLVNLAALPEKLISDAQSMLGYIFHHEVLRKEEDIAMQFVRIANTKRHGGLLHNHIVSFTGNRASRDGSKSKINAGLYPRNHAPVAGHVDWTHIRLLIEFKRQDPSLDPFDDEDDDSSASEAEVDTESQDAVRDQILNYARVVDEYQHRVCIYTLLIIGPEFRLMRFDHSGVVVTKKQDYAQNPRQLLSFLAWFDSLSDAQQGLDPTATLLTKGSRAYDLMDQFAEENATDMPHKEGDKVDATPPQLDASAAPLERDGPAYNTRQHAKVSAAISQEDESYLDVVEPVDEDPRVFKYVRDQFRESLKHDWPRYKLEVGQGEDKRIFLVGKPVWTAFWLFGRGTRGYVAFDVKTRRFVFLKDCWRPFYQGVDPEGRYLELLNEEASKDRRLRVPVVIAHGDLATQVAFTAVYAQRSIAEVNMTQARREASPSMPSATGGRGIERDTEGSTICSDGDNDGQTRRYKHYRIVYKDVCLPFTAVQSSIQLVKCLYSCIMTHYVAFTTLRLLHRDISAGNVMIRPSLSPNVDENGKRTVTWQGILTDWELARFEPEHDALTEMPRSQLRKTGTWQFMSVAHISDHTHQPLSVADELESFFHVLLHYAVRLLRHNVYDVRVFVSQYFDGSALDANGHRHCSLLKFVAMRHGRIDLPGGYVLKFMHDEGPSDRPVTDHVDLNSLFASLLRRFQARYTIREWNKKAKRMLSARTLVPRALAPSSTSRNAGTITLPLSPRSSQRASLEMEPLAELDGKPSPSLREQKIAKSLKDHIGVLNDFWDVIKYADYWPKNDVVEDRLPDTYDPMDLIHALNRMCTPTLMQTTDGPATDVAPARKRGRTEGSDSDASSGNYTTTSKRGGKRICRSLPQP